MIRCLSANRRVAGLVALVALLATSCGDKPLDTFDAAGPRAQSINDLIIPIFVIAGVVFVFVQGAVLYMAYRFRVKSPDNPAEERPGTYSDDEFPDQIHGHDTLEWAWTALPAVLLAVISVFTLVTLFELDDVEATEDQMVVEVVGQQWWWEFQYHLDGNLDTPPDIVTANEMIIPVDVEVPVEILARDVIHSFWIPRLNGKRDAVPGRSHPWVIEASETGRFAGQCTEFCGLSHAYMRMYTVAVTADEWDDWVAAQTAEGAPLSEGDENFEGQEIFVQQCSECHVINGVTDRDGDPDNGVDGTDLYDGDNKYTDSLTAGATPNLTHFMSRETFAGSFFDLYDENGDVNRAQLEAWVLNAPEEKPNNADNLQGMRAFTNLTAEQLDAVVDYLETLQ